ncbi:MAG: AraC family transcriptional regulator [Pseudomonadota bacterium]
MDGTVDLFRHHYDVSGLSASDMYEAFRSYSAAYYKLEPTGASLADPFAFNTSYALPPLLFSRTCFGPTHLACPERRIPGDRHRILDLRYYLTGHQAGLIGGGPWRTHQGNIELVDDAAPARMVAARCDVLTVKVPIHALGLDPHTFPAAIKFEQNSAPWHVLRAEILSSFKALARPQDKRVKSLAKNFIDLLMGLLPYPADDQSSDRKENGLRAAMRTWIDMRLDSPDVGPAEICRAFGVSRSKAYRIFQTEGGFSHYLQKRRLEAAFRDLAAAPPRRGRVRSVAENWGFDNPSHFHRRFRAVFGISPSEAMELGGIDAGSLPPLISPPSSWLLGDKMTADSPFP